MTSLPTGAVTMAMTATATVATTASNENSSTVAGRAVVAMRRERQARVLVADSRALKGDRTTGRREVL